MQLLAYMQKMSIYIGNHKKNWLLLKPELAAGWGTSKYEPTSRFFKPYFNTGWSQNLWSLVPESFD